MAHLSPERRRAVVPLMVLMLVGALAELVTIGALLPFLAAIASPEDSAVLKFVEAWLENFGVDGHTEVIVVLAAIFAFAALAAASIRLLLLWASYSFVFSMSYELSVALYASSLYRPYAYHIRRNSSEIVAGVNKVQIVTGALLMPLVQACIGVVIAAFIVTGLVIIDPAVALIAGAGFTLIYLSVTAATRKRFRRNSAAIASAETNRMKALHEGLGGVRDVLLDHSQPVFIETFESIETEFRAARTWNAFYTHAPRFVVEAMGIVLIAIVAVIVTQRQAGGLVGALPILGALALGAQRLLPLIQQIYGGWAQTLSNRQSLIDLGELLGQPDLVHSEKTIDPNVLPFKKFISLDAVSFAYSDNRPPALKQLTLKIDKGARVGVVGKTGSGKSTLMDLLIGLLEPTSGTVSIDDRILTSENRAAWQRRIAHVPQFIYLSDASIAENIAFGVRRGEIDFSRVREAAEQAELAEVIASLPQGYNTQVGERGVHLSGGQRQRLGIARALFRQANVLVFDEATSALDTETETAVMAAIEKLSRDLTIIVIAHRPSTIAGCDMIIRLEDGRLKTIEKTRNEFHVADSLHDAAALSA